MKRYTKILFAALLIAALFYGCGGLLKPDSVGDGSTGGGGGGGSTAVIPGSGGKTAADIGLNTDYNGAAGTPGMRIVNISQGDVNKEDITTQSTLGLWPDGKFHIEGYNTSWNGTYANAGFTDVSILYYDQPFDEGQEFKFSARVRILRAGGVSTGKGLHFGAYTTLRNPAVDENGNVQFGTGQNSKGVGMFLRCEAVPQFRLYYSDQGASTTAGTQVFGGLTELKINKEYIYELARVKDTGTNRWYYTYKLFDSKTGVKVYNSTTDDINVLYPAPWARSLALDSTTHPYGTSIELSPYLKRAVYAGVCISGTALEVSQIKVWDKGNANWNYAANTGEAPIFSTPDTTPAYVPATNYTAVTVLRTRSTAFPDENVYIFSSASTATNWGGIESGGYAISITPKGNLQPDYADANIWFQFLKLDGHDALTIEGLESSKHTAEGAPYTVYEEGRLLVDPDKMTSGVMAEARFKIVARNVNLDVPGGIDAPDYSLKQTLPEYHFRVQITKP